MCGRATLTIVVSSTEYLLTKVHVRAWRWPGRKELRRGRLPQTQVRALGGGLQAFGEVDR
jgi:hypothetical protein